MRNTLRRAASSRALSLALLLGAAACSDAPTASRLSPGPRHDATPGRTLHRPALMANHVKYRDAGYRPARGKAGSSTLFLQALVGRDGKTEVQVATNEWAFMGGGAPGEISQLRVKALAPDGKVLGTRVHNRELTGGGIATVTYGGMAQGTTLQAQANVRGIDPHRTDVPVVTGTVRRRPNLAVTGLLAAGRVRIGSYLPISATIAETNGDIGEFNDCRLYVNGQYLDWAYGIWVDAGDAVTCLFSVGFIAEGRYRVEVRLGTGSPRDDDPTDNSASIEVEAYASDEMFYSARASGFESEGHTFSSNLFTTTDDAGVISEQQYQYDNRGSSRYWGVEASGFAYRQLSRRPRVEVEEETNGARVFSGGYDLEDLLWDPSGRCGYAIDDAAGVSIFACTTDDPYAYTSFNYNRVSTRVSYHSASFSRTFDGYTGEEQVYHWNFDNEDQAGAPYPDFGPDYTVRVRVGDGTTWLTAAPTFPLAVRESRSDLPMTCSTWEYPWEMLTNEFCQEEHFFSREISGSAWSYP